MKIDPLLRARYESARARGTQQAIDELLPDPAESHYLTVLEQLVCLELELAWSLRAEERAGQAGPRGAMFSAPLRLEDFLQRYPQLNDPNVLRRLVEFERCLQQGFSRPTGTPEEPHLVAPAQAARATPDQADQPTQSAPLPAMSGFGPGGQPAETPASAAAKAVAGAEGPRLFGHYELLGELGRGGMGVVYRARQREANRVVALKVIRRDCLEALPRDTRTTAIDRFRHEARAAAQLEHDNIVTVYEVGEVEGEHFFSMRYVEGHSLAELLRQGPMGNRQAAQYLEPVARAVHQAHLRGILHRDLKPQNILVDSKTDRALVADFGLAKLSEGQEELTRAGEVMGTPSYMSPEQARDSARVTALTDVYALGATLYHMLTARPPFHAATPLETLRQVIDQDPVPPRQLNHAIDRDLETICLKCLEKEPSRRYRSAEALADDLRRYLAGQPIAARPLGPAGRMWRWCRRNPVVAALLGLAFSFLVLALVATAVGYAQTSAALRQSEANYLKAKQAVDEFFTTVSEEMLLNQPGMQPVRRQLLAKALPFYREFLEQRGNDPTVRDELAAAYYRVGLVTEALESPEKALPIYRHAVALQTQLAHEHPAAPSRLSALGDTHNAIGRVLVRLREFDQAAAAYDQAIAIRKRLAEALPSEAEYRRVLANAQMNRGLVEKEQGRLDQAQRWFNEAQQLRETILAAQPQHFATLRDRALGHFNLAGLDLVRAGLDPARAPEWLAAARENLRRASADFEQFLAHQPSDLNNQQRLVVCCRLLAGLLTESTRPEDWQEADALWRQAEQRMSRLALGNPDVVEYQAQWAGLCIDMAGYYDALGRRSDDPQAAEAAASFNQALHYGEQAVAILEKLVNAFPAVVRYQRDLAAAWFATASLQAQLGQRAGARQDLLRARELLDPLRRQFPDNPDYQRLWQRTEALLKTLGDTSDLAPPADGPPTLPADAPPQ